MNFITRTGTTLLTLAGLMLADAAHADDRFANVTIERIDAAGSVSVLKGSGGHIGVSAGPDGLLIVDDQYLPLAGRIKEALAELGDESPTWILNTHYHGDHTGGNPAFADSIIMAHDNVRLRLVDGDMPEEGLPVVTYSDEASIFFNGEEIRLVHMPEGHTDGDTIVFFTGSDVVHMGDHFFHDLFPFVDLGGGGTVAGFTRNIESVLSRITDDTTIIAGHGDPIATRADLQRTHDMLVETTAAVTDMIAEGLTIEQAVSQGLGDKWSSWSWGFINEERWIRTLYTDLSK